ncbi:MULTISPECIES: FMN-dependent NADH-azoreductase [Chelatococcus]|uniref:FMN dependent NADH:quinone oxidoreductase n=1 Tax=Chelatococcus caeni TaxID=1348468 RepID=A0A840BVJ1_9HYPH|nr:MULTISPECIES: FMN-dependent NADH-azoreductase [Chelatococcus]ALA18348.1 FMN-dependent NADH-azoreductase [Chelatococcus sp. CO-6]MBB4015498.1 FMN-dependent NADH-azoreductase [Chelatococcus caeni]
MTTVLAITSSASGAESVSNRLVADALEALKASGGADRVITRDVGSEPIPHLTAETTAALRKGETATEAQRAAVALSDRLVGELREADVIVIGAPMYNFGIPSTLKAWFDYVLRAGVTFSYSEKGPEGLIKGKRAIVIESRGGLYSEGPAQAMDSQEPHLRTMLGFIGITDVTFVRAEKQGFGPEVSAEAVAAARGELSRLGERLAA